MLLLILVVYGIFAECVERLVTIKLDAMCLGGDCEV